MKKDLMDHNCESPTNNRVLKDGQKNP